MPQLPPWPRRCAVLGTLALAGVLLASGCRSEAAPLPDPAPPPGDAVPAVPAAEPPSAPAPSEAAAAVASDRAVLLALYAATGGPDWEDNTHWGSAEPLGTWHGVTVNADGRVIGLALADNKLYGTLPAALGDLTALVHLDLSNSYSGDEGAPLDRLPEDYDPRGRGNLLQGPIPPELGRLTALEVLDLSGNELNGLPATLRQITSLRVLNLSGNELHSTLLPLFPFGQSSSFPHLEVLNLYDSWLGGPLPESISEQLEILDLRENWLTGPIPPGWGWGLPNLRVLGLSDNRLTGGIPWELIYLENLEALWLSRNALRGGLPPVFSRFPNLQALWLGENHLRGEIPRTWSQLAHVDIYLSGHEPFEGCFPYELLPQIDAGWPQPCLLRELRLAGAAFDEYGPRSPVDVGEYWATAAADVEAVTVTADRYDDRTDVAIYHFSLERSGDLVEDLHLYGNGDPVPLGGTGDVIIVHLTDSLGATWEYSLGAAWEQFFTVVVAPTDAGLVAASDALASLSDPPPPITEALARIRAAAGLDN